MHTTFITLALAAVATAIPQGYAHTTIYASTLCSLIVSQGIFRYRTSIIAASWLFSKL
jgi:hypothetical protein